MNCQKIHAESGVDSPPSLTSCFSFQPLDTHPVHGATALRVPKTSNLQWQASYLVFVQFVVLWKYLKENKTYSAGMYMLQRCLLASTCWGVLPSRNQLGFFLGLGGMRADTYTNGRIIFLCLIQKVCWTPPFFKLALKYFNFIILTSIALALWIKSWPLDKTYLEEMRYSWQLSFSLFFFFSAKKMKPKSTVGLNVFTVGLFCLSCSLSPSVYVCLCMVFFYRNTIYFIWTP